MIKWVRNWWWGRQRKIDLQILWPICKEQAAEGLTLEHAKAAFAVHAFNDPCWINHYGEERLKKFIDNLS